MLLKSMVQGHLETTDRTVTVVDMVRDMGTGTSTKAVETAATKAEREKAMALPETHHTGKSFILAKTVLRLRLHQI